MKGDVAVDGRAAWLLWDDRTGLAMPIRRHNFARSRWDVKLAPGECPVAGLSIVSAGRVRVVPGLVDLPIVGRLPDQAVARIVTAMRRAAESEQTEARTQMRA